jgi:hypothetical protein
MRNGVGRGGGLLVPSHVRRVLAPVNRPTSHGPEVGDRLGGVGPVHPLEVAEECEVRLLSRFLVLYGDLFQPTTHSRNRLPACGHRHRETWLPLGRKRGGVRNVRGGKLDRRQEDDQLRPRVRAARTRARSRRKLRKTGNRVHSGVSGSSHVRISGVRMWLLVYTCIPWCIPASKAGMDAACSAGVRAAAASLAFAWERGRPEAADARGRQTLVMSILVGRRMSLHPIIVVAFIR